MGFRKILGLVLGGALLAVAGVARADDSDLCLDAIAAQEAQYRMPAGLLKAIARVESSGSPYGDVAKPWPWTLNVGGAGHYYPTKEAAVAAMQAYKAESDVNIDVGCMQISLLHHPNAFASLEDAFDPGKNIAYGSEFLKGRFADTGSWATAVAHYHSANPERGLPYRDRVLAIWQRENQGGDRAVRALFRAGPTPIPTTQPIAMAPEPQRWFPAKPGKAIGQIQIIQGSKVTTIPVGGQRIVRPMIIYAGNNKPVVWATPNVRITRQQ